MSWDKEIIARLESGDTSALTDIMRKYARELGAIAVGITGSRDIGEDVLQDVLVKLWNNRSALGHVKDLRQYMRSLVRNHALNLYKHERYQTGLGERVLLDAPSVATVAQNDASRTLSHELVDPDKIVRRALDHIAAEAPVASRKRVTAKHTLPKWIGYGASALALLVVAALGLN